MMKEQDTGKKIDKRIVAFGMFFRRVSSSHSRK